ncbi:MAG: hypothetical protein LBG79_04850 [Spirochaetaceae bacterium]|jgi:hypothetical protein|nr:hypothetical protein [Spirochaetaceae bacterium]GMO27145.1 MAG: P83/100 family protein [Termitinemataceae bacterium]
MKKKVFRNVFAVLFFIALAQALAAQEAIDSSELQKATGPVEFISNTASPTRIDSRAQILQLGSGPGQAVRGGAARSGSVGRYFVIHRLHPEEFDKLDADIFGLGAYAGVDTIANLRLIISGFLQSAYDYNEADAGLLAEYITIYNAVYRRNRAYFEQRYKTPLLEDLTPGSEGLALRYNEWPGNTLMLVPLMTAAAGSLSAIDTTAISDPAVINKMREDPDKGIDSRQDLVALKEREAEAAAQAAEKQKQENLAEQKRVAEEQKRIADEQKRIANEKAGLEAEKASASTAEQRAALAEKEAALKEDEAALKEDKEALQKQSEELAAKEEATRKTEAFADLKSEEAQRDRATIASDQRELIAGAAKEAAAAPPGVLAIRLSGQSNPRGTIIKINPTSGATLQTSPLNQVSARSLTQAGGKTIVVATSGGKTRLVEVDPATLQTLKQGEDDLNADTQIWLQGANLYAIINSGGKNYVGKFDVNLAKQAQSKMTVHPWAALNFQGDKIITQNDKGAVVFMNASTLTE